jgi:hypothetical protein
MGAAAAGCVAVGALAVAVSAVLGYSTDRGVALTDQTPTTAPAVAAPVLECPPVESGQSDRGPASLATGATAARLCGGDMSARAPRDLLTTGMNTLVASVNAQPEGVEAGCYGPIGDTDLLLLAYPDGTERRVLLNFSGCGSITVGEVNRRNPDKPYETFMNLLRDQRRTATPPPNVPAPACLLQNTGFAPVADPGKMVAARLCVSYNDNGRTTSVAVPAGDLETILGAWSDGSRTPEVKGPGCGPTTPTWVLSGVTQWGDPVQITADCNRPTNGNHRVALTPQAQQLIDRLVDQAGIEVDDGANATTAWSLVSAWLTDVNAHAVVNDDVTAADFARTANSMWVRDPWLPEGELDWDLVAASRTEASGWRRAWRVPARTPDGQAVFLVVRSGNDQPWRILSLTR